MNVSDVDDTSPDELERALLRVCADPMPEALAQSLDGLLVWRTIDEDLALLAQVGESSATTFEGAGIRGGVPTLMRFPAGTLTIDVEVSADGAVVVQLDPEAAAAVTVRRSEETLTRTVMSTPFGVATFSPTPYGPARVEVRLSSGDSVATDWFTL